jgi:hypothetical protein
MSLYCVQVEGYFYNLHKMFFICQSFVFEACSIVQFFFNKLITFFSF